MKFSLWTNMKYVYRVSIQRYPKIRAFLLVFFICSILVPLSATLVPTIVVYALTNSFAIEDYLLVILLVTVATFILEALRHYSLTRFDWENTFARVGEFWVKLSHHQITADYPNIEPRDKQTIASKAFEALGSNWNGVELMLKQTPQLFVNVVGLLVYGVLIAIYSIWVLPILVLMSVVNYFLTRRANKYQENIRDDLNKEYREKNYLSKTATNNNYGKDIRIYKLQNWFNQLFVFLTKKRSLLEKKSNRKYLLANLSDTVFLFIRDAVSYYAIIRMVVRGDIEVATFTFLIGIVSGFTSWLNGFMSSFNDLRRANIQVNDYRNCLDIQKIFKHDSGLCAKDIETPIEIEFQNVSFTYPSAENPTIQNLSFTIKGKEKVALVGNNGAGKTTIIKLLCGMYAPTSGKILINNRDLLDFNINEYMSLLSVVFQDSQPLALTILANITCAKEDEIDKDLFWKVVEMAGLKEKIESLPDKENSFITQTFDLSGIRLSGGETQKLMLARALYKNAPLLILDEPTASLDPISEEKMYLTYHQFAKDHTSLFISHRLSSTKFCDTILYLEDGAIAEQGTHEELIEKNGKYKEIFEIQSKYYKEDQS